MELNKLEKLRQKTYLIQEHNRKVEDNCQRAKEKREYQQDDRIYEINYNQVEEKGPHYSMGGRFEKCFLNIPENYDNDNSYNLGESYNGLPRLNNLIPNHNVVKPSILSFSMAKADRFAPDKLYENPGPDAYNISDLYSGVGGKVM